MITKNPGSRSLVVRPTGDLDALAAEHIRQRLKPLLGEGYRFVIFDLEETGYVTSSGLGLLVEVYNQVARSGGALRLVHCGERIQALLSQTRLDEVLRNPADPLPLTLPFDELHSLLSREVLFSSRLHELTDALLEAQTPQHAASLVLEGLASACGARRGGVFLYSLDGRELTLAGTLGLESRAHAAAATVSLAGDGLERTLVRTGEDSSVWCIRLGQPPEAPSRLQQILGFERGVLCCLKSEGNLQAFVLLEEPDDGSGGAEAWIPQLRLYCEISSRFLARAHRVARVEHENAELRRRLAEAQRTHEILVDVGKLAALGTVVSGVGHLLNNKLVPIIGYTQMLAQLDTLPDKAQQQLRSVNTAAMELKNVMERLIRASRAREIEAGQTDLNQVLNQALNLLTRQMEDQRVRVRLQLDSALPSVAGDADLLLQAFLVLLHRASLSFSPEARDRWVEIRTRALEESVEILLQDNGMGLGPTPLDDWIDPLAPYIATEEGSGHNFSVPRSVIRRHSGELTLAERPGGGTSVRMTLPARLRLIELAPVTVAPSA